MIEKLCRLYQTFFPSDHPEQNRLVSLHSSENKGAFLQAYFEHEYAKGVEAIDRFKNLSVDMEKKRALDFGCGAGGLTYRIAERCSEAAGIDIEQYKIDHANQQRERLGTNVEFVCYDGETIPFEDNSFDLIFCIDVAEHLPRLEHYLSELARVLKPDGDLLLSFGPPWMHAHGKHMWSKLPGWWTHLLFPRPTVMKVAGFSQETTWEELGIHRLTVKRFEQAISTAKLETTYFKLGIKKLLLPIKHIPWLREFFVSGVITVMKKQ